MTKRVIVLGFEIEYEWKPDKEGLGGQVSAPDIDSFHADSPSDAREKLYDIYSQNE